MIKKEMEETAFTLFKKGECGLSSGKNIHIRL